MSFLNLCASLSGEVSDRLRIELTEVCASSVKKRQAEYFDFYLESSDNYKELISILDSLGFYAEHLSYDTVVIKRPGLTDCSIPSVSLLRIYNAAQEFEYPAIEES